ncbi:VanZ family protein [Cetobacterium ceti]
MSGGIFINKFFKFLTLIIMITIFYFSQQDGTNSLHQSNFFYKLLGIDLKSMGIDIRKLAHFSIYFALGFSCLLSFSDITRKHIFYSVIFSFVYALTDEFHQSLIPGRGPHYRCFNRYHRSPLWKLYRFFIIFFKRKKEVSLEPLNF